MNHKNFVISFVFVASIISSTANAQSLEGKAEIFEPGVISLKDTWDEYISFSPDGTQLSFTRSGKNLPHHDRRIYLSQRFNGEWTEPQLAPFSSDFTDRGSSFSPGWKYPILRIK